MLKLLENNNLWNLPNWLFDILIIAIAVFTGFVLKFCLVKLTKYYKSKNQFSFIRSIVLRVGKPLNFFLPFVFLSITKSLIVLSPRLLLIYNKLVEIGLIITFAYIMVSTVEVLQDFIISTYDLKKENNLKERKIRTQLQFLRKILVGVIVVLTFAAILFSFDGMRKLGAGLLTGVGVSGIIVGFAAQKSLGNLLAGFQIAFTQPIRIDDVLVIEGEWGKVEEITLTYVVVHIWDERRLILPINYFIETPFQNWTRNSAEILGTVFIYADYGMPINELRNEFDSLLNQTALWNKKASAIQVTDAKQNVIEIRALMSADNSSDAFDLRCYIRENLIDFIQKNYPDSLPKVRATLANENKIFQEKAV